MEEIDPEIYKEVYKCTFVEPTKILDGVYLGNYYTAKNNDKLISLNITHIIRVGKELKDYFPNSYKYFSIRVDDEVDETLYPYFSLAYSFIEECLNSGGTLLVHCKAGVSRSTTVLCAYIMKKKNYSFKRAIQFIKNKRPCVDPNIGFTRQLREFYMKEISKTIRIKKKYKNYRFHINSYTKFTNKDSLPLILKKPTRKKCISLKVISIKMDRRTAQFEDQKIRLHSIIEEKLIEISELNFEDKRKQLMSFIKRPLKIAEKLYKAIRRISNCERNKIISKLSNIVKRLGHKIVNDLLEKEKN